MNIFFLHRSARICARLHCDKHVVKMILEYAQLLSGAWHVLDHNHSFFEPTYKLTHKNHPCAKWVRSSVGNYKWLCKLGLSLCKEYTFRYGKVHKSEEIILNLSEHMIPINEHNFTEPPQAMPDLYKDKDAVFAYHKYYMAEKKHILNWKKRKVPKFKKLVKHRRRLFEVL